LLPELLADLNTGHNIVATVFEECRSMYRATGSVEMRPVGEVEFVAGVAAMSARGDYGPIKVAQGIVGYADLALGDRVEPVLEALIRAGGGGFRAYDIRSATMPTRRLAIAGRIPRRICMPGPKSAPEWLGLPRAGWCLMPGATIRNSPM
jgi:hypothetical protein